MRKHKTELEKVQRKYEVLQEKRKLDKKKYQQLISDITSRKRKILSELNKLEEKIKDIMYIGGLR